MTQQEALSFLLTSIVVERNQPFKMTAITLFELMTLASEAVEAIDENEDAIAHEILETYAAQFTDEK